MIITTEGPRILWKNDDSLSSHYHTPLLVDGHLYGFHGRLDTGPPAEFRCVELKTGQVKWKNSRVDAGAIIGIGNEILILTVNGQLLRGSVSPSGYTEMGRKQVLGFNVRAHPALAENRFYARDESKLVCILLQ